jgi:hypothetical protein
MLPRVLTHFYVRDAGDIRTVTPEGLSAAAASARVCVFSLFVVVSRTARAASCASASRGRGRRRGTAASSTTGSSMLPSAASARCARNFFACGSALEPSRREGAALAPARATTRAAPFRGQLTWQNPPGQTLDEDQDVVNGVAVNVRKHEDRVSVWTRTTDAVPSLASLQQPPAQHRAAGYFAPWVEYAQWLIVFRPLLVLRTRGGGYPAVFGDRSK